MKVLSFGGGTQSTALALMCETGRLPVPDVAVFADTGWEPPWVYETVEAVSGLVSFDVEVVGERNLAEDTGGGVNSSGTFGFIQIPAYMRTSTGVKMGQRQCTKNYKIVPVERAIRRRLGVSRLAAKHQVELWLGITRDEIGRVKANRNRHITNRFPLLDADLTRQDCLLFLQNQFPAVPVGKSSCVGCPYRSAAGWRQIALEAPAEFQQAVQIDRRIRYLSDEGEQFLHQAAVPLEQAVRQGGDQPSLLEEECEGWCGF